MTHSLERLLDEPLNTLVAIEVRLDVLLRSLLIDVELRGQPKRADAIHDTKVDGLSTRARLLIHRCSIDTKHLASSESVDVFTGSVSIKQQWILREVSHQAQLNLRIVGRHQNIARSRDESRANLASKRSADGNVLQIRVG